MARTNVSHAHAEKKSSKVIKWSNLYSFRCLRPSPAANLHQTDSGQSRASSNRVVFCNDSHLHEKGPYKYANNTLSTTKYNVVTFLPKSLFQEFQKVANLYFLIVAVVALTPLAPVSPISLIAPLLFVIGISLLKEGMENWHRFSQDSEINSRKVRTHAGNGVFVERSWKLLRVGDIGKVTKNQYFPSDLLLLSSSYEDGICYIQTMNLDGETNIKTRRCLECTSGIDEDGKFTGFKATVRCEDPNSSLYTFVGNLEFGGEDEDQSNSSYSLSPTQILLRGSKLQNTDYVYGAAVFTGPDTKVIRNSLKSPSKRSRVERKMNNIIYLMFLVLLILSIITSIGSLNHVEKDSWYLHLTVNPYKPFNPENQLFFGLRQFLRALVLYGYLVPISLYVSIEVVKFLQAMLINKDRHLFDEMSGKSVEARTSNLNEELGQVEMVLSDKTGTLTCNQMEFRKCSIGGICYGNDVNTEGSYSSSPRCSTEIGEISSEQMHTVRGLGTTAIKGFSFTDHRLTKKRWIHGTNIWHKKMFMRVMAICHTGVTIESEEESDSRHLKYEAESPEEVTFLTAVQEFGFQFCRRTQSSIFVKEIDDSALVYFCI